MQHVVKGALLLIAATLVMAFAPENLSEVTPMQQMYIMKEVKPDLQKVGIIWNKNENNDELLTKIRRAATSLEVQVFLAEVAELSDIAPQFRTMTRQHKVEAIWVLKNDGLVDSSAGKGFLIKNAMTSGLPLFAPSQDWVDEGAFISMAKGGEGIHLFVNKSAADALSLVVPEKYAARTQFAAN